VWVQNKSNSDFRNRWENFTLIWLLLRSTEGNECECSFAHAVRESKIFCVWIEKHIRVYYRDMMLYAGKERNEKRRRPYAGCFLFCESTAGSACALPSSQLTAETYSTHVYREEDT
jgi:hypothetical protein